MVRVNAAPAVRSSASACANVVSGGRRTSAWRKRTVRCRVTSAGSSGSQTSMRSGSTLLGGRTEKRSGSTPATR